MEAYLRGIRRAFGHKCSECRFYCDNHCSHPDWRGSKNNERFYGDKKYANPDADACVLFDGEERYGDETGQD